MPDNPVSLPFGDESIRDQILTFPSGLQGTFERTQLVSAGRLSMMGQDALDLLFLMATHSKGPILEIGPYVGGSTICIALGNRLNSNQLITVEIGGLYEHHPKIPSRDIVSDLKKNLRAFGVTEGVDVVVGSARSTHVIREVESRLSKKLGLIFMDADADYPGTFFGYINMLRDDCFIVIDDYLDFGKASEKAHLTKSLIDKLIRDDLVIEFTVTRYGTWFGQIKGAEAISALRSQAAVFARKQTLHDSGACYCLPICSHLTPDSIAFPNRSDLQLFENAKPLGPAHSLHHSIRVGGKGRYSHWGEELGDGLENGERRANLYFATSDSTDPRTNGRRYSVLMAGNLVNLWDLLFLE